MRGVIVLAVGHRRRHRQRRAAAECALDDRFEPRERGGRQRVAVRDGEDAHRAALESAQQAPAVRFVQRQRETRRAIPFDAVRPTRPARAAECTTTMNTLAAIRCSHVAAFSLAGARIAATCASSGTGMPVRNAPGASAAASNARTCSRIEEGALPRGPVFEREPADVESGDHAQRQRGGREMQDARRARRVQRCGEARPIGGERGDAAADHVVIAATPLRESAVRRGPQRASPVRAAAPAVRRRRSGRGTLRRASRRRRDSRAATRTPAARAG